MSARHTPARLVVGMSGATGAIIGVRLLERLREIPEVQTHLVISRWARSTIEWETSRTVREVSALADVSYSPDDQAAAISSGSFRTIGMIVAPCSMKTVAAIRSGYADGLLARAADVTLKERRKLVLVPRETPLNDIHLDNLLALSRMGVVIAPPMPAFYRRPETLDALVDHTVSRLLDQVELGETDNYEWQGFAQARTANGIGHVPTPHTHAAQAGEAL
ncbi:UbiX family flavin prenyltransferase [Nocardia iowensis]|uniref:Probable UbiX-like flavin prenyltransferase n=1 Tax=Nocardia iowensis TaxID=204891 RepID=A0ABX8S3M6_NOCIO|nr:UbiX family flavin prenyltransferase [Nocardia iowensis]QXN94501.1 UbiX family flavin prenyltransferase [Nocardia iowensis]